MWLRPTLVISLAVAVHAIDVLLDDECEGNECSLEMLHLRAKKMAVEKGSSAELQEVHGSNLQDEENSKKCLTWANCRNGFFNGIKCSGGRYCTKWGGGRVCKKYVSCRNGFFNGINCHGSRYCVTWGLLQEGEEESAQDIESQNQEADSTDGELNMQEENDLQNDNEENGKKCLTWANCRNGFFNGIKCSGGRYCTKWGGGRVCKKYVSCRNGFFNGINCHGSRYCVTWGLLQEGEEESAKDIEGQNQEADSTDGELNMQEENDLQNDNEENGKKCLTWAKCRNGFFNGIKCSGGRYCTKWGGGGVMDHSTRETETRD